MERKRFKKGINEIPIDIVEDILARLPLKDLTKFRCVCRRWAKLIVDEEFAAKRKTRARRTFLSLHNRVGRLCSFVYEHDSNGKPKMIVEEVDLTGKASSVANAYIAGHVNGLFCLQLCDKDIAVWNPCLKQLRRIISPTTSLGFRMIGFGYDHSMDDYKIIAIPPLSSHLTTTLGEIFTLKSGSWVVDFHSYWSCVTRSGTLLDRHLFWLAYLKPRGKFILRFDLVSETFKQLPCPPCDDNVASQDLVVIKGRICVINKYAYRRENKIVVWSRDECTDISDKEAWNVWFTVPMDNLGIPDPWISLYYPKHFAEETGLLMRLIFEQGHGAELFTCNLKEGDFAKVETDMTLSISVLEPYEYMETLVSPWLVDP